MSTIVPRAALVEVLIEVLASTGLLTRMFDFAHSGASEIVGAERGPVVDRRPLMRERDPITG